MINYRFIILAMLTVFASSLGSIVLADEAYVLLSYSDSSKVYRVTTSDEFKFPTGYMFACEPAEEFYVDTLKNFRLLNSVETEDFVPLPGYIYRQVFDDSAMAADFGSGHSQHQDSRGMIKENQAARPVFRPIGAPFSAGPGKLVNESLALTSLSGNECELVPGKNWYQIPNSSWYQSWFSADKAKHSSYTIFFDSWEERKMSYVESFWRGYVAGKALERNVGAFAERRLLRARVDGAMEIMDNDRDLKEVMRSGGKLTFLVSPSIPGEGELYFYTWLGSGSGKLLLNGKKAGAFIATESRDKYRRFAGLSYGHLNEKRVHVIGSDVVQKWLRLRKMPYEGVDCSLAAFSFDDVNKNLVAFVYSTSHACLYRFVIDEADNGEVIGCEKIGLGFQPQSMVCTKNGNLYLTALEVKPADFASNESLIAGFEALHVDPDKLQPPVEKEEDINSQQDVKRDQKGLIIFAQTHFAGLHLLRAGQKELTKAGEIFLDKEYACCDFSIKDVSNKEMAGGITAILKLAAAKGNSMSEIRHDVPGFPDQHRRPERVLASVYESLVE